MNKRINVVAILSIFMISHLWAYEWIWFHISLSMESIRSLSIYGARDENMHDIWNDVKCCNLTDGWQNYS